MRRLTLLFFTLFYACTLLAQPPKRPFTFDDLMALKRVGDPQPSPDGKWIAFSVVDVDLAVNKKVPHLWITPVAGGESREVIAQQDADRPRWSPDGRHFAFLSNKEGGAQIWVADFDSNAGNVTGVHKLTSIATEADGELWSPDGKNILFVSDVYPECKDEACNKQKLEQSNASKVKAQLFTHLLYRHWNGYKESKRTHLLIVPAAGGASRDVTPGDFDAPVFSLGGQDNYAFSPDGQEICYSSNHDEVGATSTNNDLWLVPITGGQPKNITAENKASDESPQYSPDGRYIAYRMQTRPGYESDRFRLVLYDRKSGQKQNLTEDWDRWVGTYTWAPDSQLIYFAAENHGTNPIYRLTPTQGAIPEEVVSDFNDDVVLTRDGHTLLFTRMSIARPNEIYSAPTTFRECKIAIVHTGEARYQRPACMLAPAAAVTHFNDALLANISMAPLEPFEFQGAENKTVQGFLIKPPNFNPATKYPVKFLIHGGPQGAWGDDWSYRWNPELFAANGYVVITVNPRGSTGYGQQFIDDINGDWGGRAYEDLMKGLDHAEQNNSFIDKNRECALGASYGGYMVNWILGHTNRFKCLVTHDGMFNTTSAWGTTEELWFNEWEFKGTPYNNRDLYNKWSPHLSALNFKTPTLVVHGQLDYRLDVSEGFQLFTTLQRLGVPSEMLYFPDEGHWVLKPQNSQLWYQTVNAWVDRWAGK
ncbi:MAG: S9 family peptidase [Acidobacteriales bacterium]|nr:S9 family peptidase [Terriglobales bacterium]